MISLSVIAAAAAALPRAFADHSDGPAYYPETSHHGTGPAPNTGFGKVNNNNNQSYFIGAYRVPNATNSVPFSLGGQEGWTWR